MKVLLLVDVQYDFLPGGKLAVQNGDLIIPIINDITQYFDLVIATQDWHPQNHISFASNHSDKSPFEKILLDNIEQVLWPDHCIQGSLGADLSKDLNTNVIETIFRKGTDAKIDSYSGFFDNGHLKSTGLSYYLKEKQTERLYVAGLAADFCVYYTIKDALAEGFDTCLIEDATQPINADNFVEVKKDILQRGGKIITSRDIKSSFT